MPEGYDRLKGKRGTLNPSGHCPKQGTVYTALQGSKYCYWLNNTILHETGCEARTTLDKTKSVTSQKQ